MDLNEYQRAAMVVSTHPIDGGHICLEYAALALCGEAGELANKIKKLWRRDGETHHLADAMLPIDETDDIVDELGDVFWYGALLAERLGVPLEDVAKMNLAKLERRNAKNRQ